MRPTSLMRRKASAEEEWTDRKPVDLREADRRDRVADPRVPRGETEFDSLLTKCVSLRGGFYFSILVE